MLLLPWVSEGVSGPMQEPSTLQNSLYHLDKHRVALTLVVWLPDPLSVTGSSSVMSQCTPVSTGYYVCGMSVRSRGTLFVDLAFVLTEDMGYALLLCGQHLRHVHKL